MELPNFTIGSAVGDHLRFKLLEIELPEHEGFTFFSAAISVRCDGFISPERPCLFLRDMFDGFLVALTSFEVSRVGRATLESLPSSGFTLTIASDKPTECPVVFGTVTGPCFTGRQSDCLPDHFSGELKFAFELDSGMVGQLLRNFGCLLGKTATPLK